VFEAVKNIAKHDSLNKDTEEKLDLFLRSWWSKTYSRPLKDPILQEYTLFELLYEYHDKIERIKADRVVIEQEADKIEDEQIEETLSWIEEEEKKEKEEAEAKKKEEEWMIKSLKEELGDDFGQDINLDFSE
jgi:hypothetical protein